MLRRDAQFATRIVYAFSFIMNLGVALGSLTLTLFAISLGATPMQLGLIGTVWPVAYTASCLVTGPLSDRLPRMVLPISGSAIACLSYAAASQATSPFHIMLIGIPAGVSFALFWPPVEAWVAELSAEGNLRRNIGSFNISWSVGAALGPLLAGLALNIGVNFSLSIAVSLVALAGFLVALAGSSEGRQEIAVPSVEDEEASKRFLHLAWVANFGTWFTIGIVRSLFPKLAQQLGMSSTAIGALLSALTCVQVITFALLSRTSSWHYRLLPLTVSQILLIISSLLLWRLSGFFYLAAIMAMMGGSIGVSYFSSIYYSINTSSSRGAKSGIHEALIGMGIVAGPLMGGIFAQSFGLRAPYLLSASVVLVTMLLSAFMGMRNR